MILNICQDWESRRAALDDIERGKHLALGEKQGFHLGCRYWSGKWSVCAAGICVLEHSFPSPLPLPGQVLLDQHLWSSSWPGWCPLTWEDKQLRRRWSSLMLLLGWAWVSLSRRAPSRPCLLSLTSETLSPVLEARPPTEKMGMGLLSILASQTTSLPLSFWLFSGWCYCPPLPHSAEPCDGLRELPSPHLCPLSHLYPIIWSWLACFLRVWLFPQSFCSGPPPNLLSLQCHGRCRSNT